MHYIEHPTTTGFYWYRRPPHVSGFWWQKKTQVTPGWEMCFVNKAGMHGEFAVKVGTKGLLRFSADVEWYGPVGTPDVLYELMSNRTDLQILQQANLERIKTD